MVSKELYYMQIKQVVWPQFRINHVAMATVVLICLVTLTFELLTMKLVHIIVSAVGNIPTNFGVSVTFLSRLWVKTCQTHHVTS